MDRWVNYQWFLLNFLEIASFRLPWIDDWVLSTEPYCFYPSETWLLALLSNKFLMINHVKKWWLIHNVCICLSLLKHLRHANQKFNCILEAGLQSFLKEKFYLEHSSKRGWCILFHLLLLTDLHHTRHRRPIDLQCLGFTEGHFCAVWLTW